MDELSAAGTSKHVPRPGPENPGKGERTEERSSIVSRILLTPDGLRPIWRLLLYVSTYLVLKFIVTAVLSKLVQEPILQVWLMMIAEAGLLTAALVPALLLSRMEERPFGAYGFPLRNGWSKNFAVGVIWGLAAITLLMLALRVSGVFHFGPLALHGFRVAKFAVFWGALFLLVGFYEEFLVRGYTQFTLSQETGFWPAAAVLSVIFGALHLENPGESLPGICGAVCIGLFFCLTLRRTGSLWFAVGFHAAWDWSESFLYSVPDSGQIAPRHLIRSSLHGPRWLTGGSTGPEASVLLFVVLLVVWIVFDRAYPKIAPRQN
ncbi:MAG TPA: type II CAAX endopeptidase family protein [Terriglobales bacterium]|nr:type II CAAX endopeptidase family protein [Terriglobales bacterium]